MPDMKPGRELDARVAIEVMEYAQLPVNWFPSINMADAWDVIEKYFQFVSCIKTPAGTWLVAIGKVLSYPKQKSILVPDPNRYEAEGETASHGICLAALKAKADGVKTD